MVRRLPRDAFMCEEPVRNERQPFPLSDMPDKNWLACSAVPLRAADRQVGRLLLRQNRINDPVIRISFTIQK